MDINSLDFINGGGHSVSDQSASFFSFELDFSHCDVFATGVVDDVLSIFRLIFRLDSQDVSSFNHFQEMSVSGVISLQILDFIGLES